MNRSNLRNKFKKVLSQQALLQKEMQMNYKQKLKALLILYF